MAYSHQALLGAKGVLGASRKNKKGASMAWNKGWRGRSYQFLRYSNDFRALSKGKGAPIGKRVARRGVGYGAGRATGGIMRALFGHR